jgi:hypothetical protein
MRKLGVLLFALLAGLFSTLAQEKPTIVVQVFTLGPGVSWPYEMKQMQLQTMTELKVKDSAKIEVVNEAPAAGTSTRVYNLSGEVLEWHAGNKATRMLVGVGTGRESAKIHYWLTDKDGKKVFEHSDTIRQAYWGNEYAASVGQLAQPFADKIVDRLKESKLF